MDNDLQCASCGQEVQDEELLNFDQFCIDCEEDAQEAEWYAQCELAEAEMRGDYPFEDPFLDSSPGPDYWIDPESGEYRCG